MSILPISQPMVRSVPAPSISAQHSKTASFENAISKFVEQANTNQLQSDESIKQLANGEQDSVQDVVMSVAKADLSFRLLLEIRNRLVDSYQELMRMQV